MPHENRTSPCRRLHRGMLFALALWIGAGCATPSYKPYSQASPSKPKDYPIPAYAAEMRIPRPCQLIGTVSINAGKFTVFGGSSGAQLEEILLAAHEKGADAVRFVDVKKPDFLNPNYRMKANLLRYADVWETVSLTNNAFQTYLQNNRANLDPIEGVWLSTGAARMVIGIMKNNSRPGREFIGFILSSTSLAWPPGTKKLDIRRGPVPDSYTLVFYMEDFAPREIPIMLKDKREFTIRFRHENEEELIYFGKNFNAVNGQ